MGNFEKLSVLVIVVIIVMILVVALYTWTDDPAAEAGTIDDGMGGGITASVPGATPSVTPPGSGTGLASAVPGRQPDIFFPAPGGESGTENRTGPAIGDPIVVNPLPAPTPPSPAPSGGTPAETPPPAPAPEPAAGDERTHVVQSGETLGQISQDEYGTTRYWKRIADHNGISDPLKVRVGMRLRLPRIDAAGGGGSVTPVGRGPSSSGRGPRPGSEYTVRAGDTLPGISQQAFGTKDRWPDIWTENLSRLDDPSSLRSGMTIRIPN